MNYEEQGYSKSATLHGYFFKYKDKHVVLFSEEGTFMGEDSSGDWHAKGWIEILYELKLLDEFGIKEYEDYLAAKESDTETPDEFNEESVETKLEKCSEAYNQAEADLLDMEVAKCVAEQKLQITIAALTKIGGEVANQALKDIETVKFGDHCADS